MVADAISSCKKIAVTAIDFYADGVLKSFDANRISKTSMWNRGKLYVVDLRHFKASRLLLENKLN
jgi:hypothetical protein